MYSNSFFTKSVNLVFAEKKGLFPFNTVVVKKDFRQLSLQPEHFLK